MLKSIIKNVLARYQRQQAQKAKIQRQLNNRMQRDLIIQGLEERGE